MGQLLIRNVDDSLIETLKQRASVAGRSMEAEARDALARGTKLTVEEKIARVRQLQAETEALKVPGAEQTPGWILIRESRDER